MTGTQWRASLWSESEISESLWPASSQRRSDAFFHGVSSDIAPEALSPEIAFFWAVWESDLPGVESSIAQGADCNASLTPHEFPSQGPAHDQHAGWPYSDLAGAEFGDSALHIAARKGNAALVTTLITHGADRFNTNDRGQTPANVATGAARAALQCPRV